MDAKEFLEKKYGRLTFGRALKADRMSENMTQEQLAVKVGLTKQAISGFENGKDIPTHKNLKKIAKALKVDEETYVSLIVKDIIHKKGFDGYEVTATKTA